MSKRRSGDQNNDDHKKKRPKITLEDCPAINNLTDLIAIGKTNKCFAHGGGKKCNELGCHSSAQGKTDKCVAHGGGKRCNEL